MGNVFQRSGGGSPTAVSTPVKPDHEAHVQFAREFVVELVETVPKKSEKAALAKHLDKEDIVSLKSVSPSEGSFQSVSTVTDNASLPDLLQPESVYKKQTDTDTDTTEYESAAETDPSDSASPIGNLIAEDLLASFQEALDKKYPPSSSEVAKSSDPSDSQDSDPSPLSEAYEDVSETVAKPIEEVKSLDISGLCYYVSNLCLDSPKSTKDVEETSDSIVTVTDTSINDNTFTAENSTLKLNDSALILNVGSEISPPEVTHTVSLNDSILISVKPIQVASSPEVTPVKVTALSGENTSKAAFATQVTPVKSPSLTKSISSEAEKTLELSTFEETAAGSADKESEVKSEETSQLKVSDVEETTATPEAVKLNEDKTLGQSSVEDSSQTTSEVESVELITETSQLKVSEVNKATTTAPEAVKLKEDKDSEQSSVKDSSQTASELESVKVITETSQLKVPEVKKSTTTSPETVNLKEDETSEESSVKNTSQTPSEAEFVKLITETVTEVKPVEIDSEEPSEPNVEIREKTLENKFVETSPKQSSEAKTEQEPLEVTAGEIPVILEVEQKLIEEKIPEAKFTELETEGTSELKSVVALPVVSIEEIFSELKLEQESVEVTPAKTLEAKAVDIKVDTKLVEETPTEEPKRETLEDSCSGVSSEIKAKESHIESSSETTELTTAETSTFEETKEKPCLKTESVLEQPVEVALEKETDSTSVKVLELNVSEVTKTEVKLNETSLKTLEGTENTLEEEPETKTEVKKTDSEQKFDVEICNSENIPLEETPSVASVTDSVDDKLLESKDFSTSFEVLSLEKEISEFCEDKAQLGEELGGGDCRIREEKKGPTVLTELFEICDRQQKDLELSDEKFVEGREFFTPPSSSSNLNETLVVRNFESELLDKTDFGDFDESITEEAEKIYQEILNGSSQLNTMADIHDENSANPFVTQSSLRRSPPPSAKASPRSSSQGASPSDSPRARSKLSLVNQVRDNCSPRDGTGESSPRSRSGKNSPDRRITSNRMDGSPKTINAEINQSEAGPDIAEDANLQGGDVFKDPAAFDFLNSVGNSNTPTDLRKESLYVKFDPLIGGARTIDPSVPLPPAVEAKYNNATSPVASPPTNSVTPPKYDAISVVDKLISLSPSPRRQQVVVTPVKQEEPNNSAMVEELYLLREILAKQDEKHREDILKLQHQIESLQEQLKEFEDKEARLNKKLAEKAQGQKQMSIIMEEYEKTISRLVAEKEQERQAHELDKSSLLKERDTAMGHLANIEIAFSDLHKKYERSKTVIEGFKKNEEVLRASLSEYEATIRKQEQKYDVLKSHAMAQLENANQELDSVRRSQQAEAAKLKAMLKKAEIKTSSLEEMLEQKVKENQELASICDELINKVGSSQ